MRILIVDDSSTSRKFIRQEFEPGGFEIFEAQDGEEALTMARRHEPHLITLDVNMPHLDGYVTCAHLRTFKFDSETGPGFSRRAPIVFITSTDSAESRTRAFEVGATDFLTKPFHPGALMTIAQSILRPPDILRGTTALVVEDSNVIRHVVTDLLSRHGVTVLEADDGAAALEWARDESQRIDLILTDYLMPGMNGDELCAIIRASVRLKDVPIIFVSGVEQKQVIVQMFKAGATDFLIKPFDVEELLARIHAHLKVSLLNRELVVRNTEMTEELKLAGEVQRASIQDRVAVDYLRKSVLFLPHGQVSGDVYDFAVNARGEFCLFLGDATGHGVGAAFMTMMIQSGLDTVGRETPVELVLRELDRLIGKRGGQRFVTGIYVTITPKGVLTSSRAGHPPLILLPGKKPLRTLSEQGGIPLGLGPSSLPYGEEQVRLQPGDKFFLYSDGVTEWEGRHGEQFGTQRLLDFLERKRTLSVQSMVAGALEELRAFAEGQDCADDCTLIGFEFLGA